MIHMQDGLKHIFPKEFTKIYPHKIINLIDIREPYELVQIPIKNALNLPLNLILTKYNELLRKDETYYIICHHGQRSYLVTEVLTNNGFDVINVVGGIDLVSRFDSLKE